MADAEPLVARVVEEVGTLTIAMPGTRVRFTGPDAGQAVVLKVEIRGAEPHVASYEVAWWAGGDRNTAWVESHEIEPWDGTVGRLVGFGG